MGEVQVEVLEALQVYYPVVVLRELMVVMQDYQATAVPVAVEAVGQVEDKQPTVFLVTDSMEDLAEMAVGVPHVEA